MFIGLRAALREEINSSKEVIFVSHAQIVPSVHTLRAFLPWDYCSHILYPHTFLLWFLPPLSYSFTHLWPCLLWGKTTTCLKHANAFFECMDFSWIFLSSLSTSSTQSWAWLRLLQHSGKSRSINVYANIDQGVGIVNFSWLVIEAQACNNQRINK